DRPAGRRRAPRRSDEADHARVGRARWRRAAILRRGVARRHRRRAAGDHRRRRAHPPRAAAGQVRGMFDGDLLSERARLTPDKTALVCIETGRRLTYAELDALAARAAAAIVAAGVEPGDRYGSR